MLVKLLVPFLLLSCQTFAETIVYTSARQHEEDRSYFIELLGLSLALTEGEFQLESLDEHMNQERQILTVREGNADVMWTMTTDKRESILLPVRFPLLKGYIGKRVFVIRKDKQHLFPANLPVKELKSRLAIQGLNWPDTKILHHNTYKVATVDWGNWYENLFLVIRMNHGDYFPRSVIEAPAELARFNYAELGIERNHMFDYPAYMYFFVTTAKPWLAKRIFQGLQMAKNNGQLEQLFLSFPHHLEAEIMVKDPQRRIHKLDNPFLTFRHR